MVTLATYVIQWCPRISFVLYTLVHKVGMWHCLRVLRMHFSLIFTRHEGQNANFVECNASDADFNSHSMPSLVSLSSSSYSSDSALSQSSSASQSSALRSLSPSSAFRFHQSHCDSNALGYHMLWVAGGICVTASAVTATAGCYVTFLTLLERF